MIIKFQEGDGWMNVGNVQDWSVHFNDDPENTKFGSSEADITYHAVAPGMNVKAPPGTPKLLQIIADRESGKRVEIITNRIVYICNDAGKTIDKYN